MKTVIELTREAGGFDASTEFLERLIALVRADERAKLAEQPAQLGREYRCCPHDSDCSVHNEPAYPAAPCDCTYKNTHNLPPSAVVHEICLTLLEREVGRREDDNFGRYPNDPWSNKVVSVYHFFNDNPKAKKLTVIYTTPQAQPAREWVGLTDDEFEDIEIVCRSTPLGKIEAMRKVEAKLREKNT